jgi:hypothetical protein
MKDYMWLRICNEKYLTFPSEIFAFNSYEDIIHRIGMLLTYFVIKIY